MKQVATLRVRPELPLSVLKRMKSQKTPPQSEATRILKDVAFALHLTRRIRAEMEQSREQPRG